MSSFFDAFMDEALARRRRIASAIGPRMQGLFDLAILGGVTIGSVGLFVRDWMPAAAPWGFGVPVVYALGHLLLEIRRQSSLRRGEDAAAVQTRADLFAVLWGIGSAAVGAVAFFTAWGAEPAPPPPDPAAEWTPPATAVAVDVVR